MAEPERCVLMSKTKSLVAADPAVFVDPFRVDGAKPFHLTSYPTAERGGIDKDNIAEVVAAGADILVAGSAVFGGGNPETAVRELIDLGTDWV